MHPLRSEKSGVVCGNGRKPHQRAAERCIDPVGQKEHFLLGICSHQTASEVDIGPFGLIYIACRFFNADILGRKGLLLFSRGLGV